MPLTVLPPSIPGRSGSFNGQRVYNPVQGPARKTHAVKIDLANSAYVTGGWPLTAAVTGLTHVTDMYQMAGFDPFGRPISFPATSCVLQLVTTDPSRPLLKLIENGAQATNASTRAGTIWVIFTGRNG